MTRKLNDWIGDERAVSPVIGVILMVAITVILAAVIGTFVLDLGQSAGQSAPQASLSVSLNTADETIDVEHSGGDALVDEDTRILIENSSSGNSYTIEPGDTTDTFTVGQTLVIGFGAGVDEVGPVSSSDVWDGRTNDTSLGANTGIQTGTTYTITLIDTNSQRQIFESEVTA